MDGAGSDGARLDGDRCYRAVLSKDSRFDGWFVGAVTSTGIYCRPSCPVRPPRRSNMRFYPTAAAAQQSGFRACKRCRPDASPGSPEWDPRADVVGRAMRLIADGTVDRNGVDGLARTLGYSSRQVERVLRAEVGTGPLALARAQRARTARTLIETSDLSFAEVCFASGFSSVRQFNATVREVYDLTPGDLRRRARRREPSRPDVLDLRLAARTPFDHASLFRRLGAAAIPGVEACTWDEEGRPTFRRTMRMAYGAATVALTPHDDHVAAQVRLEDLRDLTSTVARCRWLLDLDADPVATDAVLSADPLLARAVELRPGMRVPRSVDGAEMAVRVVLAQQVSTAAACTHAARLVAAVDRRVAPSSVAGSPPGSPEPDGPTHLFPTPSELLEHWDDLGAALPSRRRATLRALVGALADGDLDLGPGADRAEARRALGALSGIGPWTVEVIAMRALGDPDALPDTDLVVRRGAERLGLVGSDTPPAAQSRALVERSSSWAPWRSVAAQHLWSAGLGSAGTGGTDAEHEPVTGDPAERPSDGRRSRRRAR